MILRNLLSMAIWLMFWLCTQFTHVVISSWLFRCFIQIRINTIKPSIKSTSFWKQSKIQWNIWFWSFFRFNIFFVFDVHTPSRFLLLHFFSFYFFSAFMKIYLLLEASSSHCGCTSLMKFISIQNLSIVKQKKISIGWVFSELEDYVMYLQERFLDYQWYFAMPLRPRQTRTGYSVINSAPWPAAPLRSIVFKLQKHSDMNSAAWNSSSFQI